jgi:hypothetical protein
MLAGAGFVEGISIRAVTFSRFSMKQLRVLYKVVELLFVVDRSDSSLS